MSKNDGPCALPGAHGAGGDRESTGNVIDNTIEADKPASPDFVRDVRQFRSETGTSASVPCFAFGPLAGAP